ncbi:CopD family protein [Aquipuribacter sp. SD81]|uniref:CopD family protein n=1 Tax=Aquipuribacter sp. SD81 TaxID=3127703 RepID=UPI0030190C3A
MATVAGGTPGRPLAPVVRRGTSAARLRRPRAAARLGPSALGVLAAVALVALLVAVLVAALRAGGGAPTATAPGLPDAGLVTRWGLPALTLASRLLAVVAVGDVLLAAWLLPRVRGAPGVAAARAWRGARAVVAAWAVTEALRLVLLASTLVGEPAWQLSPGVVADVARLPAGTAAAVGALLLAVTAAALGAVPDGTARRLVLLPLLAAAALPVLTGHGAGEGHRLVAWSLVAHVVAALLWLGAVVSIVRWRAWLTDPLVPARRLGPTAVTAVVVLGVSGPVSALALASPSGTPSWAAVPVLLGSGYGVLLAVKSAALGLLVVVGAAHRRRTLPLLAAGRPGAFRRLLVVEVVVMAATVAVAVALAGSPPPAPAGASSPAPGPPAATDPAATDPAAPDPAAPDPAAPDPAAADPAAPDPAAVADGPAGLEDMSGHDHGELSVGVLLDGDRAHVGSVARPGRPVTVYNSSRGTVTLTAEDGGFALTVPGRTFATFEAPAAGDHPFTTTSDPGRVEVLVVRAPRLATRAPEGARCATSR